jgi:hypothetical protein
MIRENQTATVILLWLPDSLCSVQNFEEKKPKILLRGYTIFKRKAYVPHQRPDSPSCHVTASAG